MEDDPFTRERLELLLEAAGLGCVSVGSAAEARVALQMLFFPIVLIDRVLPDADGIELCHEVRKLARDGHAYILLLSGLDSADDIATGIAAGADDYLSKRSSAARIVAQLKSASRHVRLPTRL